MHYCRINPLVKLYESNQLNNLYNIKIRCVVVLMVHSEKMDFQIKENTRVKHIKSQNIKLSVDGADIQTFKMKGFLGSG